MPGVVASSNNDILETKRLSNSWVRNQCPKDTFVVLVDFSPHEKLGGALIGEGSFFVCVIKKIRKINFPQFCMHSVKCTVY